MKKTQYGLVLVALIGTGFAEQMSLWQKIETYFERKKAVKEWQAYIHQDQPNYQQALKVFSAFNERFHATEAEKDQFRNWKKSVRSHATPDGLIYNARNYMDELDSFREQLRPATPNDLEKPPYVPVSTPPGTKISMGLANASGLGYWVSAGYKGNPDVAGGATGNGGAEGVAFDPNSPNIVYACVRNGGLWKSTDYGKSYSPLTDYFESPYCNSIGVGTDHSNVLYLWQSGKMWYSDDGGQSWENRGSGISGGVEEVHVDPLNSSRALAASDQGLYLTQDAGLTWTQVLAGTFRELETTTDWSTLGVAKDAGNGNASFFMSKDQGRTWSEITVTPSRTGLNRLYLAFHQKPNPDSLVVYAYLLKTGNTPTRYYGLYRSNDRGQTFSEVTAPGYAYPNGPVAVNGDSASGYTELGDGYGGVNPYTTSSWVSEFWVSPLNPDHMITMREKLWYSVNGGKSWNYGPSYGEAGWADRRFATANPTKDTLWICDDGGLAAVALADLFPWKGNSSKYIYKNGTIAASEGTNLGISAYNKDVFLTGGQDVGQVFQRNGKSTHVHKVDVYRGQINPWNDSLYWTSNFIFKLTDTTTVGLSNQVEPDRFDKLRVYGFDGNAVLYRTKLGQNAWSFSDFKTEANASTTGMNHSTAFAEAVDLSTTGVSSWNAWTFEQSRALADLAFIGDEKGKKLFKTENLSADHPTWTQVVSAPAMGRYRIATHPHNSKLVALAGDKAVWLSRDGGQTWTELKGFPASGVIGILFDPNTSEGLYVCNALTVWYRDESMSAWSEFNRGLPLQQIVEMKMAHYSDGESRLWIAKYGRGVWSSPLVSSLKQKSLRTDFAIHSLYKKAVYNVGDSVKLYDLSSGEIQGRTWTLSGPGSPVQQNNTSTPVFALSQAGVYTVKLKVQGPGSSDSLEKKGFIYVQPQIKAVDSVPPAGTGGAWYLGIGSVNVNGLNHASSPNTNLFYEDLTKASPFQASPNDSVSVQIVPSYNDATWGVSLAKVYVDYNNSGSFDSTELVYASAGSKQGHSFKFLAPAGVPLDLPLRMRVIANRNKAISGPYASQAEQGQMEDHSIVFNTPAANVTVAVSAKGSDSLILQGSVSQAKSIVDQGFIYSAFKSNPEMSDAGRVSTQTSASQFNATLSHLPMNRKYYVRAYTVDSRGTWLSNVDSMSLNPYHMPVLETMAPFFDTATRLWTARARLSAESQVVDSLSLEWGVDGAWNQKSLLTTPAGVRASWDTVQWTFAKLPRYSSVQYRLKAKIGGQNYVSSPWQFSSEKDLYAYWNFDDSGLVAKDYSGFNRHATLSSGLTRTSDGRGGQALQFDTVADVASMGLGNLSQPFSVLLRVKRNQNSPMGNAVLLNGSNRRLDLEGWNNTRKVSLQAQTLYDRTTTYSAPLGEWHQIAFSVTNDTAKLFVDGSYHSSWPVTSYALPLNTMGQSGYSMLGLLDEIKVYSSALSASELQKAAQLVPVLQFAAIPDLIEGGTSVNLSAQASLGKTVRFEIASGNQSVSLQGQVLSPLSAGTAVIRALIDGDSQYAADTVERTVVVQPRNVVGVNPIFKAPQLLWKAQEGKLHLGLNADLKSAKLKIVDIQGKVLLRADLKPGPLYQWEYVWNLGARGLESLGLENDYVIVDGLTSQGKTIHLRQNLKP